MRRDVDQPRALASIPETSIPGRCVGTVPLSANVPDLRPVEVNDIAEVGTTLPRRTKKGHQAARDRLTAHAALIGLLSTPEIYLASLEIDLGPSKREDRAGPGTGVQPDEDE